MGFFTHSGEGEGRIERHDDVGWRLGRTGEQTLVQRIVRSADVTCSADCQADTVDHLRVIVGVYLYYHLLAVRLKLSAKLSSCSLRVLIKVCIAVHLLLAPLSLHLSRRQPVLEYGGSGQNNICYSDFFSPAFQRRPQRKGIKICRRKEIKICRMVIFLSFALFSSPSFGTHPCRHVRRKAFFIT